MNRTVKKMKLEGSSSSSSRKSTGYSMIHSGHYMTSCLHDNDDNDDDTVEMPIASPDATNNEVTMAAAAELEASSSKSASTTALSSSSSPSVAAAVNVDSSGASGGANSAASSSVVGGGGGGHGSSGDGVPMTPPSVSVASSPGPVMFKKSRLALFSSTNGHKSRSMMPKSAAGGGSEERTSSEGAGSGSGGVATVDDSSVRNIVSGPETVSAVELMNAVKNEQIALSRGQTAALILPGGDVNMQDAMANARKNLFVLLCAQQGSISGGLTLDKTNKSLMKLIFYIKTAYSNNLTSPKWKNFKGFKLQVTEKIRINNVIWRSWFEQFGFKDSSKRKRRLVCQFSIGMGDETTMSTANTSTSAAPASVAPPPTPKMSDRENKFWKARLESITNEYKKWRELSRKQIKATTMNADGTPATTSTTTSKPIAIPSKSSSSKNDSSVKSNSYQSDKSMIISQLATSSSTCLDESSSLFSSSATATTTASSLAAAAPSITVSAAAPSVTTLPSTASVFNSSAATTPVSAQIGLAAPMPAGNNMSSGYYYGSQGFELNNASASAACPPDQLAIQTTGSFQSYGQPSTSAASYSGNSYASSSNSLNPYAISAMAGGGPPINTNSPNFSSGMTNSVSTAPSHYHHSPIASKQMPYNNRCRSPSPGLFQDFDLYSFSSDTLFSTYLVEDTKDPVFGTNPDFFQPDLMHLYPNFDFFELCDNDFMSSATTSAAATAAKSENKSSSPVVASHHLQNYSSSSQPTAAAAAAANNQQQQQHYGRSQSSNFEQTTHIQNLTSTTSQSTPNSADTATSSAQQDARKYSLSSVDYSNNNGLSNFDTLVHVATAAQNVQNHKQQPSPDVLQYNNNRSLSSTSASNSNSNNTAAAAASSNNSSNSANTIRNLLAMNNTNNNSATNSNTSTAPTVSPKLPSSSMRSSMLSSKLQQHQHHQSNAIQTPSPSSKSTPAINGGLNQPPMLNNPVVSSLSQILEKSNTAATAAAMMMNNKSKSVALNEGGNSQTISSLLAALSSASSNISSANQVASSPSTSGDASIDNPSSGHKGKRGRKGLDPLKLSPSNSANSVVVAAAPIKSKANYNSKKDMKYTLADPIDDNNLEVKQQQQQQQQPQMAVGNNNPYQTAPIYDLMNSNPSNNTNNYNSRHYHHGPQQHHHQNGGMNNTESVHSINSTPTNSPPSSQNNNYNPHGYMTLVAPPPPPPPPPPPQAYESDYMMAKNAAAATSSSSSRHHLLASSSSSASSSPPNDTAAAAVATYSALNPIASGLNGVVAASGLSAAPPGSVLNRMNRSSSVTSVNTLTDANLSNAEQKRRCNIQHGFDRLQMLVPSLLDGKSAKVSKAVMLQKTSEYIKELQTARENRMGDLAGFKRELDELSDKIVECQSQLPANGVSVASGKLNRTERYEQKFNAYIKERTLDNWRFYIFSLILRPLFDSFLGTVTMSSKEDMQRTFEEWTAKSCNLTQLRPIASTALRQLVKSTSILTDSSRLPEECLAAVLAKI